MRRSRLLLLSLLALATGCMFTQAELDVHLDSKDARRGPLARVSPPVQFQLMEFEDSRVEREPRRIGFKKDAYGDYTANIVTPGPVAKIVREAVQLTFERNGHTIDAEGPLRVEGNVQQFWFEVQQNFWNFEFMGTAECKLKLTDAASGSLLYEATYTGYYNETSAIRIEGPWLRVMNQALARMVESIAMDDALSQALSAHRPVAATQ